jgi:hypothetical protein
MERFVRKDYKAESLDISHLTPQKFSQEWDKTLVTMLTCLLLA